MNASFFRTIYFLIGIVTVTSAQQTTWSTFIDTSTTFSSPRAVHLNTDTIKDIIIGGGLDGQAQTNGVVAIDGQTGQVLWRFAVEEEIFGSATFQDINSDGIEDVFIGGRYGEFYAIDGSTGQMIWEFFDRPPTEAVDSGWFNFYSAQWVPDQNFDGLSELLVANGGNHSLPSWITERDPGYLMVLDAATGSILAKDTMPDGKETYCSPVVADFTGLGHEIVFGSGGEDVGGSLWRVPLVDLMSNNIQSATVLAVHPTRGFIAPSSLSDVNGDQVLDIVNVSYNGHVRVFDGQNSQLIWDWQRFNTETSAAPTIGNFTGDITPDVYVVLAQGHAPSFTDYFQVLIDGANGNLVWIDSLSTINFSSASAVDIDSDGRDEVLASLNYHTGTHFTHQISVIDFDESSVSPLSNLEGGVNLGSSILIDDLDQDGDLDIVFAYRADSLNPMGPNGFKVSKIQLNTPVPPTGIAWGAYMGTSFDGKYNYEVVSCTGLSAGVLLTPISCNGFGDGMAVVQPNGGTAPYTHVWSTGAISDTTYNFDVGTYYIRVIDSTGCYVDDSISLSDPYNLLFGGLTLPTCFGDSNATIQVNSSGCQCMFSSCTYQWSNNASINKIGTNLWAGWQYVTITHTDGCIVVDSTLIPDAAPLITASNVLNVKCQDYSQGGGKIDLLLNDPANTSLVWSTGQTTSSVNGLQAGTYTVSVSTLAGCSTTDTFFVTIPDTLLSHLSGFDLQCFNDSSGVLSAMPTGGTGPYDYFWSSSDTTAIIYGLSAGMYSVFILDSLGCFVLDSIAISEPDPFTATATINDVHCHGDSSGSIMIQVVGGQGMINFNWSNNSTDTILSSIFAGAYTVQITDSAGCTFQIDSMDVNEPSPIQVGLQSDPVVGNCDGTITAAISGGVSPYQVLWSTGDTTTNLTGLCQGLYTVIITDANGCSAWDSVNVTIISNVSITEKDQITVFPNPVHTTLQIQSKSINLFKCVVVNMVGQVVYDIDQRPSTFCQIPVHGLEEGMYYVRLYHSSGYIEERSFVVVK